MNDWNGKGRRRFVFSEPTGRNHIPVMFVPVGVLKLSQPNRVGVDLLDQEVVHAPLT